MNVKLLTEHHFEFLSLKGGYTGSSESTLVKMPHVTAQISLHKEYAMFDKHDARFDSLFISRFLYEMITPVFRKTKLN